MPETTPHSSSDSTAGKLRKVAPVIVVGSVMFSFISYWRVAAVVLCDMASTAFYIGGIVEQLIGPAAPWFILGVMLFSYAVRAVYIESCSLFVRGGVYRVVKEAMGGGPAKAAVSALLFDYILTGPISGCSAGQYLIGLILDGLALASPSLAIQDEGTRTFIRRGGAVIIAIAITLYFFRKNIIGIHESSSKALRIMYFTSVVAILVLAWSGLTLFLRGPMNSVPLRPDLSKKFEYAVTLGQDRITGQERELWVRDPVTGKLQPKLDENGQPVPRLNPVTGRQEDPLGFLPHAAPELAEKIRNAGGGWLNLLGVLGLLIAFGHSILAMSGEETMAQVYREVESPKLPNFKKAAFVIFMYSLILTAGTSFLAVLLIPDEVRMKEYADNLLGGLAMHVVGPIAARLALNALVVIAGFLILAGAVNTSIIGSNGVLNRVAEDGVLPDALQKPHQKYGTTYRLLYLIVGLQIFTIIASGGNMIVLGEAYAFGVIWSFLFNSLSMLMLRFRNKREREFKVPFNLRLGGVEIPVGLGLIALSLGSVAIANLFTKEVATVSGLTFATLFMTVFVVTERVSLKKRAGQSHEHLEQVTQATTEAITPEVVGMTRPYRKLVAIRSPQNLYMLQKALSETDPDTTDVVVMTAKVNPVGSISEDLDRYDRRLITAIIELSEKVGKKIKPLIVPTNNPLFAVINTARQLHVHELVVGASNKYTAEEQLDQMSLYWINLHEGNAAPLTIRVLSRAWDVHYDISGGSRIPKIAEQKAKTVSELRAAGMGVQRVLMAHDATPRSSDLFRAALTMLDEEVVLDLVSLPSPETTDVNSHVTGSSLVADREQAEKLGREIELLEISGEVGPELVRLADQGNYDLLLLPVVENDERSELAAQTASWVLYIREHAHCVVALLSPPPIPRETDIPPEATPQHPV